MEALNLSPSEEVACLFPLQSMKKKKKKNNRKISFSRLHLVCANMLLVQLYAKNVVTSQVHQYNIWSPRVVARHIHQVLWNTIWKNKTNI